MKALLVLLFIVSTSHAQTLPLFSNEKPLEITIKSDFDYTDDGVSDGAQKLVPAELNYQSQGQNIKSQISLSVRGHSRKMECEFNSFKITFGAEGAGPEFSGLGKSLKVVSHCDTLPEAEYTPRFILREFLIYKMIEATGYPALKTRLLKITYVKGAHKIGTYFGFAIEPAKVAGKRDSRLLRKFSDAEVKSGLLKASGPDYYAFPFRDIFERDAYPKSTVDYQLSQIDLPMYVTFRLIQLMAENYDYHEIFMREHNIERFLTKQNRLIAIPYDFDRSLLTDDHTSAKLYSTVRVISVLCDPYKYYPNLVMKRVDEVSPKVTALCPKAISDFQKHEMKVLHVLRSFEFLSAPEKAGIIYTTENFFAALGKWKAEQR